MIIRKTLKCVSELTPTVFGVPTAIFVKQIRCAGSFFLKRVVATRWRWANCVLIGIVRKLLVLSRETTISDRDVFKSLSVAVVCVKYKTYRLSRFMNG